MRPFLVVAMYLCLLGALLSSCETRTTRTYVTSPAVAPSPAPAPSPSPAPDPPGHHHGRGRGHGRK